MIILVWGLLLLTTALPIAWLASEFKSRRSAVRCTLGVLSIIAVATTCALFMSAFNQFDNNAYYGGATSRLIDASFTALEAGREDRVKQVWLGLGRTYRPTYEYRADYAGLVEAAAEELRAPAPSTRGSTWNPEPLRASDWNGHWASDHGFWLNIDGASVFRSGDPPKRVEYKTISADARVLTLAWSDYRLTLTLRDATTATLEWFDTTANRGWKEETMHKLVRAD